jgi:aspartate aminotransferase
VLSAAGEDVLTLAVGEPDFDAPAAVRQAAREAVEGGQVRYTPAAGRLALRRAIAQHLERTRGVAYAPEEIVVCHSGKHALSGAILSLVEPGDEVLLLLPAWVSYAELVRLAGGVPVGVRPRPDLGLDPRALAAAIGPRTRGILLNSPSNPSGCVLTRAELAEIGRLARERDLWLVSDEIYARLVYEGEPFASPVQLGPEVRARTVIVDGASKTYAMTGYRIGYLAAPREVAAAVERLHSQTTGSPNAISQDAFRAALEQEPREVPEMVATFARRREIVLAGLARLGLEVPRPRGAFYVFPRVPGTEEEGASARFCEELLEVERLALVPGSAFGLEGHVRLGYACSETTIREAVDRLGRFLARRADPSGLSTAR